MVSTIASYQLISKNLTQSLDQTAKKPDVARETAYYLAHIGNAKTIDDFIGNYRLFSYAMKAYGLSDMTYAKAFVRKVLSEGVASSSSFANKLSDTRYKDFATAFNFASLGAQATQTTAATTGAVDKYTRQTLEEDAGKSDDGVRLALYFARKAPTITNSYQILADKALLQVAQTALAISPLTSMASIDRQATMLTSMIKFSDFQDAGKLQKFLQRFSLKWDAQNNQAAAPTNTIYTSQPIEAGISADMLASLQNLKIGR